MKVTWLIAGFCILALGACQQHSPEQSDNQSASNSVHSNQTAASNPASASDVAQLPPACQTLLANIEKCVVKYEGLKASDADAYRLEFEQLKAQIVQGTDAQGLEAACVESNKQAEQLPQAKC